ncbi:hypothetical protein CsSME_00047839 [Camellia sinensis var. sinensis]
MSNCAPHDWSVQMDRFIIVRPSQSLWCFFPNDRSVVIAQLFNFVWLYNLTFFLIIFCLNFNGYVPGLDNGKRPYFLFVKSKTKTPGGLLARPFLTSYYKSKHFKIRPYDPYNVCTSPNEAILCPDSFQSMYTQMLCGLLEQTSPLGRSCLRLWTNPGHRIPPTQFNSHPKYPHQNS